MPSASTRLLLSRPPGRSFRSVLVACALLVLGTMPSATAEPRPPDLAGPGDPALDARVMDAAGTIGALRGLTPTAPVRARIQSRAEMRASLEELVAEELSPDEIAVSSRLLRALGLLAPDVDFLEMVLGLYEDQVAGYYDTRTGTLYLLSDDGLDQDDLILVHELFHAIQDQHFGIRPLQDAGRHITDVGLARSALIEGDAMAVMIAAMTGAPVGTAQGALMQGLMDGAAGLVAPDAELGVPHVLWRQLLFPYSAGMGFVLQVHAARGWEGVNDVYARAPVSSRAILQPRQWLEGWEPTWLDTPDLAALAGQPPARAQQALCADLAEQVPLGSDAATGRATIESDPAGPESAPLAFPDVRRYAADVLGVLTGAAMVQQLLEGTVPAARVEQRLLSLAGDRLDAWRTPADPERDILVWLTVWDSAAAAGAAGALLVRLGEAWVPAGAPPRQDEGVHGQWTLAVDGGGALLVERWGDLVLVALDRGGHASAAERCTTLLMAAERVMTGHSRSRFPDLDAAQDADAAP